MNNPAYGVPAQSPSGGEFRRQSSKLARSAGSSFAANVEERSNNASDKHQTSSENTKKLDNNLASKRPCAYTANYRIIQ